MPSDHPPHIVFILSDQHHASVIGAAGHPHVRTPNLDALRASGMAQENCYCASPLCVPSRASILSGRLPTGTGVFNNGQALRSDEPTFVHSLAVSGYKTVLAGRMHFNGPDQRHGYMERLVGDITPSFLGRGLRNRQYGSLLGTQDQRRIAIEKSGGGNSAVLQFDRAVTDATCDFLDSCTKDTPLFLTVGYYGPHCPFVAPPDVFEHYFRTTPKPELQTPEERAKMHPAIRKWQEIRGVEDLSSEVVHRVRAAYFGMVEYLDGLIGEVLDKIEQTLGRENVLIVYASDHGESLGEHGLFWKSNFYDGASRVPLIFSLPGTIPAGITGHNVTSLLDLAPTLLSVARAKQLPVMDGVNLMPELCASVDGDVDRFVVSQLADIKGDAPSAMVRQGRWKLIKHHGYEAMQLFDLTADPNEITDLGIDPAHSSVRERLSEILSRHWDGEAAAHDLNIAQANAALLGDFARATALAGVDEWYGDEAGNIIIDDGSGSVVKVHSP